MIMTLTSILCLLAAFNAAALAQINPSQLGDFGFLYNLTLSTTTFDRNTNLSIHYSVLTTPGSVGTEDLGFHLYPAANNTAHYQNYPVNLGGVKFKWNNSDGNIVPVPMEYVIEESSWAHAIPSGIYYIQMTVIDTVISGSPVISENKTLTTNTTVTVNNPSMANFTGTVYGPLSGLLGPTAAASAPIRPSSGTAGGWNGPSAVVIAAATGLWACL
ncbi:hypothetical protein BC936DRAFT_143857 [Jimgerdemannia flammicorona]|uniref:Ser-Thr-rich glycosyl-phosphatidyl-inositol-anchored membrane family-domain-containing protein n=1 Tax=Jimgerdemannia flammicorona TaxID=994334 RepID=A0A432ZYL7_9FUNG|nr:hypothetical protein BC936DRAFT_143857 [Jimgerdemannia flammicorona]